MAAANARDLWLVGTATVVWFVFAAVWGPAFLYVAAALSLVAWLVFLRIARTREIARTRWIALGGLPIPLALLADDATDGAANGFTASHAFLALILGALTALWVRELWRGSGVRSP